MKVKLFKKKNIFSNMRDKIKSIYRKKILKNRSKFSVREVVTFMLITFGFGLLLGGIIMYGTGMFGSNSSLYEFASTYNEIINSYYDEVDSDKLLEAGISGMVRYLGDPYTTFMTKENAEVFNDSVEGVYHGIGAEIKLEEDGSITIGQVFEASPAEKSGLKTGDVMLKVNGESIEGKSLSDIANIVKGEDGTTVTLTIRREEKEMDIKVTRGTVDNVSVISKIIERDDRKIGYISIAIFANNTYKQFKKELEKIESEGIDSLIIDVRSNSGGYLTSVTDIISLFMKKGDIIYQLKTKDKIEKVSDDTNESRDYDIVVLTNSGSASASEVLTGALKESYGAKVVGTKTYGKGKVQKVHTLSNGAMIKYTHQEWLTPDGNYIDGVGIEPTVEEKYIYNDKLEDNQLEKAIEVLLQK